MCTSIVEITPADGMAKREDDWFSLTHAVVAYDHARHALLDDAITIDFVNHSLPPGARAGVELTLDSAKALVGALERAIAAAEIEESQRPRPDEAGLTSRASFQQAVPETMEPVAARSSRQHSGSYPLASSA